MSRFSIPQMKIAILVFPLDRISSSTNEHVRALKKHINGKVTVCTVRRGEIPLRLSNFDALILHHSSIIYPYRNKNVGFSQRSMDEIKEFSGAKLAFAQDEYRSVLERRAFFDYIELDHLFSLSPHSGYELLYGSPASRKYTISTVLPGYITEEMLSWNTRSFDERFVDIGYRGRRLPTWMGEISNLKSDIVEITSKVLQSEDLSLNVDFSANEHERLYGNAWKDFLNVTKSQIATSSGSSILDMDGRFVEPLHGIPRIKIEKKEPISFDYHMMSPRILEYAASGNLIIKISGHEYGEALNDNNSLTLFQDASNLESIAKKVQESQYYGEMIRRNEEEIVMNRNFHYYRLGEIVNENLVKFGRAGSKANINVSATLYCFLTMREDAILLKQSYSFRRRFLNGLYFYLFKLFKLIRF